MTQGNSKIKKIFSVFFIISVFLPYFYVLVTFSPRQALAQAVVADPVNAALNGTQIGINATGTVATVSNLGLKIKEVAKAILTETLKAVARKALAEMTKSTVNWINTGFHGAPLFLENPGSFFQDVAKSEIKDLVSVIGYDSVRFPFGKDYLLGVIGSYKRQLSDNLEYSMSRITNDPYELQRYRVDFSYGGWDTFMVNTQYPQNNVIGFDMLATKELAINLEGTTRTAVQKVNDALEQGQGFLSPQVCKSDPTKSQLNPFNKPRFDESTVPYDKARAASDPTYASLHKSTVDAARANFDMQYACPEGLATTTPGSVVASKIMGAMNKPEDQASLSASLGNSLATIFDALLNKFIGDGLTALSNHVNPTVNDSFNYYGETLGGSDSDTPWSGMPDQEIVLEDFKKEVSGKTIVTDPATGVVTQEDAGDTCAKSTPPSYCATPGAATYIPGAIANTALELQLISNNNSNNQNPGLIEVLDSTWPVAKRLDMCIPGPNKEWEQKLDEERDRLINGKIMLETTNDSELKVKASRDAIRELRFAVTALKDWINTKMISALPSSILFIDAVKELDTNNQQYKQLTDKKREKMVVIARLNSIETLLSPIITQPAVGSPQEKNLIKIKKQYDAIAASVANSAGIEDLRSQLDLLKERKQNLLSLENQCNQERIIAGWSSAVEGGLSKLTSAIGNQYWQVIPVPGHGKESYAMLSSDGSELVEFCKAPIVNGYSHGDIIRPEQSNENFKGTNNYFTFRNLVNPDGLPGYTDVPMVNAYHYYGDYANGFPVNVDIDCKLLFKVNDNDYKHAGDTQF